MRVEAVPGRKQHELRKSTTRKGILDGVECDARHDLMG
jgi:hypothetical protein